MSLRSKLILSFAGVVLLTWLFALFLSYGQMRQSFRDGLRTSLMDLASSVSSSVDGDLVRSIQAEADEQKPEWRAEREKLIRIKQSIPKVRYLYVYKPSPEAGKVQMVVGGEPFDAPDDEVTHVALGDYSREKYPRMHEGFEKASADDDINEDKYGVWLSGYAPIYDRAGQKVGAVGLDYPADSIRQQEAALLRTLGLSSALALVFALGLGYVLAGLISRPLLQLVRATDVIAGGDLQAQVDIERKDEIGALARSFNKMVRNLRDMAAALQGYAADAVESKELEVAGKLQRDLLPAEPLVGPGVAAGAGIRAVGYGGGAMYDYFLFGQDAYLMFSMGKVSVPGLQATTLITLCKSGLTALVSNLVFRPQEVAARLNQTVANAAGEEAQVAYLCGVYDLAQGWLTLVNAGHSYPYLLRPGTGGAAPALTQVDKDSGPALGAKPGAEYTDFDIKVEPGDRVVLYSPSVLGLRNAAGQAYGLEQLEDAIRRHASLPPQQMQHAVLEELVTFRGKDQPLDDDLAVLVVHFGPGN